jgi:hypothetical protein
MTKIFERILDNLIQKLPCSSKITVNHRPVSHGAFENTRVFWLTALLLVAHGIITGFSYNTSLMGLYSFSPFFSTVNLAIKPGVMDQIIRI